MKHLFAATLFASAVAVTAASPAAAQSANEKINMVIAYSEDECPTAQPGEVVVCEILVEADRYRIPSNLRQSASPAFPGGVLFAAHDDRAVAAFDWRVIVRELHLRASCDKQ